MRERTVREEKTVDMTHGKIMPQLVKFMLPVFLGLICQRVYNFADCYIVGRYLGDNALSAVSISGTAVYLLMSLMIGLTTGVSVVMSQNFGAKKMDRVKDTFVSSVYVGLGFTAISTVVGLIIVTPLLTILQTPDAVIEEAVLYLKIVFAGNNCHYALQLDFCSAAFSGKFSSAAGVSDHIQWTERDAGHAFCGSDSSWRRRRGTGNCAGSS